MKKLITICAFCIAAIGYSQKQQPTYTAEGDLVKATYYHDNGTVSTEGYFKDKKLTGKWVRFDEKGNKSQMAFYKDGKKVGKWFIWGDNSLKEITYKDNAIVDVNLWKAEAKLASNK
ncbi:nicotinic acid mononucleotide adenyltransferase [Polaribacter aestuariivivens]|uniref:Nicotinic acid mononucleotide adenyltransferase n=1 Tax=Polaribacter aestuariivivens TaxID=2304626 RepID=A0A5S3N5C1_9FLAO|nr:nicotinic acid mononucleotide adenyltransferase [Polaribacter aestuariivivens]TMM30505.1 nicotinic acid mononucleotide adenyltransferase [Polaribacter aestuariivivens]